MQLLHRESMHTDKIGYIQIDDDVLDVHFRTIPSSSGHLVELAQKLRQQLLVIACIFTLKLD